MWNTRKETPLILSVRSWMYKFGKGCRPGHGLYRQISGRESSRQTRNPLQVHLFPRAGAKANLLETFAFCRLAEARRRCVLHAGTASTHSDSFQFLGDKCRLASAHRTPRPAAPKPPSSPGSDRAVVSSRETLDAQDATEADATRRTRTQGQIRTGHVRDKAATKMNRGHLVSISAGAGWKAQLVCKMQQTWTSPLTSGISHPLTRFQIRHLWLMMPGSDTKQFVYSDQPFNPILPSE